MLFSIIVPIYKVEKFLNRCVDSILAQSFTDFEVILVDDGSPDGCGAICDAYADRDPRVRVIHKPNGGLVSARNAGIFAARGDYICYVDGDDWAKPELLAFVRDRLAASPVPLDMVIFGAEVVRETGNTPYFHGVSEGYYDRARLEKDIFPHLLSDRRYRFYFNNALHAHTWNKVCRRELQLEHYVRDERIRMYTDVPFTYEILLNCRNVYICNEPLYYYNRENPDSILAVGKYNLLTESFGYLVAYMQNRLKDYGPDIARQLNDYPALLIIKTATANLLTEASFRDAVHRVREGLSQSGMLEMVSLRELPLKPKLLILLFKLHLDRAAMALCFLRIQFLRVFFPGN